MGDNFFFIGKHGGRGGGGGGGGTGGRLTLFAMSTIDLSIRFLDKTPETYSLLLNSSSPTKRS